MEKKKPIPSWKRLRRETYLLLLLLATALSTFIWLDPVGDVDLSGLIMSSNDVPGEEEGEPDILSFVDPFIGTGGHGHTFPGAAVPFGMVQISPDNGVNALDWASGYHYSSNKIIGFSHTHLSGTGMPDLMDVSLMPSCVMANQKDGLQEVIEGLLLKKTSFKTPELMAQYPKKFDRDAFQSLIENTMSHDNEHAQPGYYAVLLDKHDIHVELAATEVAAMHKYSQQDGSECGIPVVSLDMSTCYSTGTPIEGSIRILSDRSVTGSRKVNAWASHRQIFYHIMFSKPFLDVAMLHGSDSLQWDGCNGDGCQLAFFSFDHLDDLKIIVGLSTGSEAGAQMSAEAAYTRFGFDQESMVKAAQDTWRNTIGRIQIQTQNLTQKTIFYTGMYHAHLAPVLHSDLNGSFWGPDSSSHTIQNHTYYSTLSLWDTFRAQNALLSLLQPQRSRDIALTLLTHASLFRNILPIWTMGGKETDTMPGYHAVCILAEALQKGLVSLDEARIALDAAVVTSRKKTAALEDYGYIPYDKEYESATKTLEYAYDDWCVSQLAKAVGNLALENQYANRSMFYKNIFDPKTGFMRPRNKQGGFMKRFDPQRSEHELGHFTEGTGWQYLWFVLHDIPGLATLLGGPRAMEDKLDEFFFPKTAASIHGEDVPMDITGILGRYAHGNEPGHHTLFLYNLLGSPRKTQHLGHVITTLFYSTGHDGIIGNEDCGQMSAWFIFTSMGLYPINPADGRYHITSPLFDSVRIRTSPLHISKDVYFKIHAPGAASKNMKYIKSARLNNKPLSMEAGSFFLTHDDLVRGGTLDLEMMHGDTPFS
ncbi:hypothetical protein M9434_006568 [Picochlorum sp. BPE23]|nr:hypothetical protein M9434_006568 [Picochlorum sp. BPE23]